MTKKKYTKTQLKKDQIAAVIDILEHEFDAQIDDADGGRMDITIVDGKHQFHGQFSRRDLEVEFWDSIPLHGDGFSAAQIARQKAAVELEDKVNREIRLLMASEAMFAHEESFINYMNR